MTTIRSNGNWVRFDCHDNRCFENDDEEEEEALSLCDLPTTGIETDTNSNKEYKEHQPEDFQFGSSHANAAFRSPENMCTAEEVFFQGRILPLRHSVSSDTRKINRSASMSLVSCRNNRNDPTTVRSNGSKVRNRFHSHPSPSPQIRTQSFRAISHPNPKTTSLWSFLQVGLVKPQEIGLSDLKNRSKRFGSHNSNSSSTSSSLNSTNDHNQNQNRMKHHGKKVKKKQRLFSGGCKCSAVGIDGTVKETVSKKRTTKEEGVAVSEGSGMIGERKQRASRHRTFEWLKQLSIEA